MCKKNWIRKISKILAHQSELPQSVIYLRFLNSKNVSPTLCLRNTKKTYLLLCCYVQFYKTAILHIHKREKNSKIIHAKTGTCCLEAASEAARVLSKNNHPHIFYFVPKSLLVDLFFGEKNTMFYIALLICLVHTWS